MVSIQPRVKTICAPAARIRKSYATSPSVSTTLRAERSTRTTSASKTCALELRERTPRIGAAMCAGDSPAVATWYGNQIIQRTPGSAVGGIVRLR